MAMAKGWKFKVTRQRLSGREPSTALYIVAIPDKQTAIDALKSKEGLLDENIEVFGKADQALLDEWLIKTGNVFCAEAWSPTKMRIPLNPFTIVFSIYWFPVLIPLCLSGLGMWGDWISRTHSELFSWLELSLSLLKNIHLSYVSTDIWALTMFTLAGASQRLQGPELVSYIFATLFGIVWHIATYVLVAYAGSNTVVAYIAVVLFLLGTCGMIAIRGVVFHAVELPELWKK